MPKKSKDEIVHDHNNDGIDRRGFLKCMAWAGTGALCVMEGGNPEVVQLEPAGRDWRPRNGWRTQLRADQRQPYGIQQAR